MRQCVLSKFVKLFSVQNLKPLVSEGGAALFRPSVGIAEEAKR